MKDGPVGAIPIRRAGETIGSLHAATWEDAGHPDTIRNLVSWHRGLLSAFAFTTSLTPGGALAWLREQVLEDPERLLFWVRDHSGQGVGHVGLLRFDLVAKTAAVRDVVCGVRGAEAVVREGIETVRKWAREALGMIAIDAGADRAVA
jgi:hypothetical protein